MYIPIEQIKQHFHYDPFKAMVAPRPIGWMSSRGSDGRNNLAPYSFFNAVSNAPHMLMFVSAGLKDTVTNCRDRGEFCFNLVSHSMLHPMSRSSAMTDQDEFELAGLEALECQQIDCPRVAGAPASMECVVTQVMPLKDKDGTELDNWMVLGQVVAVHVEPDYITQDQRFDTEKAALVSRCGYKDYMAAGRFFELERG